MTGPISSTFTTSFAKHRPSSIDVSVAPLGGCVVTMKRPPACQQQEMYFGRECKQVGQGGNQRHRETRAEKEGTRQWGVNAEERRAGVKQSDQAVKAP